MLLRNRRTFLLPHSLGQGDCFCQPCIGSPPSPPKACTLPGSSHYQSPTSHQNLPSTPCRPTLMPTRPERVVYNLMPSVFFLFRCNIIVLFKLPESRSLNVVHLLVLERRLKLSHALCTRSHNFRLRKNFATSGVCADAKMPCCSANKCEMWPKALLFHAT